MEPDVQAAAEISAVAIALERGESAAEIEALVEERFRSGLARFDDIAIPPIALSDSPLVVDVECRRDNVMTLSPQATRLDGWAFDSESFLAAQETVAVDCRVYHFPGESVLPDCYGADDRVYYREVVVPETYAPMLDEVRTWRLGIEANPADPELCAALAAHPLGQRALPEDVLAVVAAMPFWYQARIYLLADESPQASWARKFGPLQYPDACRIDSRLFEGAVCAFLYWCNCDHVRSELFRWWSYTHDFQEPEWSRGLYKMALELASELEGERFRVEREEIEALWARDLGHSLMGYAGADLWELSWLAPIRATVVAGALSHGLAWNCADGAINPQLRNRARTIEAEIAPLARAQLIEAATAQTSSKATNLAVTLLLFLGTPSDLRRLTHLTALDASSAKLGREQLERLKCLASLKHLDLSGTNLGGDYDLAYYLKGLALESLVLRGTGIDGPELRSLPLNKSLRSLDVSFTQLADKEVPMFASLNLEHLNVVGTNLTSEGKQALQALMPRTRVVVAY
jgi:hypothetical protein